MATECGCCLHYEGNTMQKYKSEKLHFGGFFGKVPSSSILVIFCNDRIAILRFRQQSSTQTFTFPPLSKTMLAARSFRFKITEILREVQ